MSGLFGQIKDLYKLQKEAKEMQNRMKTIHIQGFSDSEKVSVSMNGLQDIEDIVIADDLMNVDKKKELVRSIKEAVKDAQGKLQKQMAKDMDIDKLKSMMGGN